MTWNLKKEWKDWIVFSINKPLDELSQEEILALDEDVRLSLYTENK
jgi:hypothetical protein|tara:strand:+ start:285 stop:422 length:138 start_codon:yes stop_codon:yes gene_type:complete